MTFTLTTHQRSREIKAYKVGIDRGVFVIIHYTTDIILSSWVPTGNLLTRVFTSADTHRSIGPVPLKLKFWALCRIDLGNPIYFATCLWNCAGAVRLVQDTAPLEMQEFIPVPGTGSIAGVPNPRTLHPRP